MVAAGFWMDIPGRTQLTANCKLRPTQFLTAFALGAWSHMLCQAPNVSHELCWGLAIQKC